MFSIVNSFTPNTTIASSPMNANFTDLASGLTDCLTRDGQAPMTAALLVINGSTSVPSLAFAADPTNGIYRAGPGIVGVSDALSVVGNTSVGGTFAATGAATLSSTLGVTGPATLSSTLRVTGASTFSGAAIFGSALTATSINGISLTTSGAVVVGTTLTMTNQIFNNIGSSPQVNIGIFNKLSPSNALLSVENDNGLAAQFMNNTGAPGTAVSIRSDSSTSIMLAFLNGAAVIGGVVNNGASVTYSTTSDRRLKDDFGEIPDPIGLLRVMDPCSFIMKSDDEKVKRYGYIADQFQKALPYAVTGEPGEVLQDGLIKPQQIAMGADGPVIAAAVLKLADRIDELINRIEALEGASHAS